VLIENNSLDDIASVLGPGDFYLEIHRQIFEAMLALSGERQAIDQVTLPAQMRAMAAIDEVEARTYVASLDTGLASSANARHHADIVRRHSLRRAIRDSALKIAELSQDESLPIEKLRDGAEQLLFAATQERSGKDLVAIGDLLRDTLTNLETLMRSPNSVTGIATGLVDLDRRTTGLHPGDLVVIAGRPGLGKTTLALNFAVHAAVRQRESVAIFSLEMPEQQLVLRILASEALVDAQKLRTGEFTRDDWARIEDQAAKLFTTRLYLDGSSSLTASQIASKSRRLKRKVGKLGMIVVDYLQLMEPPHLGRDSSRAEDVATMSRALKQLAKELETPVVALAQLSREVEKKGRRPILSDLRESGAIEQDADLVIFIHRDEIEGQEERPTELIIGKQRSGPVGTVEVAFQKEFSRFVNLERSHQFS
jgi:replicative DNA helicase